MHFRKRLLILPLALFSLHMAHADNNFGIWTNASVEKKINKKFSVDAGLDFRTEDDLQTVSRWAGSLGVSYKPIKLLKLGASYIYMYDRSTQESKINYNDSNKENGYNVDHGFWRSKHRFAFDATIKEKFGRFTIGLRERYLFTHYVGAECRRTRFRNEVQPGFDNPDVPIYEWDGRKFMELEEGFDNKKSKNRHYLRSRLKVEYDIRKCPLTPFVSYEFSNNLAEGFDLDKSRLNVGVDWKINKKNVITVGYLYEKGADFDIADDGNDNKHILDIAYKFDF